MLAINKVTKEVHSEYAETGMSAQSYAIITCIALTAIAAVMIGLHFYADGRLVIGIEQVTGSQKVIDILFQSMIHPTSITIVAVGVVASGILIFVSHSPSNEEEIVIREPELEPIFSPLPIQTTMSMPGRITDIKVAIGDRVEVGTPLFAVESMKMSHIHCALTRGEVREILVDKGNLLDASVAVLTIQPDNT